MKFSMKASWNIYIYIYIYIYRYHTMTGIQQHCFQQSLIRWWLWVQAGFRGRSIITTNPERPSCYSRYYQTLIDVTHGIAIFTRMQLETYLGFFFMYFLLSEGERPKINLEYGGWVGNETSAYNLDRNYIAYPDTSDTLFSLIIIFFQLTLIFSVKIFFKKER